MHTNKYFVLENGDPKVFGDAVIQLFLWFNMCTTCMTKQITESSKKLNSSHFENQPNIE